LPVTNNIKISNWFKDILKSSIHRKRPLPKSPAQRGRDLKNQTLLCIVKIKPLSPGRGVGVR